MRTTGKAWTRTGLETRDPLEKRGHALVWRQGYRWMNAGAMVLTHKRALRKGDQPQNWRATDPSTSGHQPHNRAGRRYFLTWVVPSCWCVSGPSQCGGSFAGLTYFLLEVVELGAPLLH